MVLGNSTAAGAGIPPLPDGDGTDRAGGRSADAFGSQLAGFTAHAQRSRLSRALQPRHPCIPPAVDLSQLIAALDGRQVTLAPDRQVTMRTTGAEVVHDDLGFFENVRQTLASPELAFLFLSLGTLAILYELAAPGVGLAGATGAVLLILGFTALSVLPFNVGGLLLVLLGAALFAAEVFTAGFGVFAVGGTISLVVGGLLLFDDGASVDPAVLWPVAVVTGAGALRLAWRARRATPTTGHEALVGHLAVVHHADGDTGQAWIEGQPDSGHPHPMSAASHGTYSSSCSAAGPVAVAGSISETRDGWRAHVEAEAARRADTPRGRAPAVFDVFHESLSHPGYRGCPFINAAAEYPYHDGIQAVIAHHRAWLAGLFPGLLRQEPGSPLGTALLATDRWLECQDRLGAS